MIPGYALQQLRAAIMILACGLGSLQKRLELSYDQLEPLIAADFPASVRKAYQDVIFHLTRDGSANETTAAMPDAEASRLAALIVRLYFQTEAAEAARNGTHAACGNPVRSEITAAAK